MLVDSFITENQSVEEIVKKGYEVIYQKYSNSIQNKSQQYNIETVQLFTNSLKDKNQLEVLQLGCGNGKPLGQLLIKSNLLYNAVQYCSSYVQQAKANLSSRKEYIFQGQMIKFCKNCESNKFGGIVAMFSIMHLQPHKQMELFMQIYRILKPNGLFLMNTVDRNLFLHQKFQDGALKTFGFTQFFDEKSYVASLPHDWYQKTMDILGFQQIKRETIINIIDKQKQQCTYMLFKRKQILNNN